MLIGHSFLVKYIPVEILGYFLNHLNVKAGDWVFIAGADSRLAASVHVRCAVRVGVVFGSMLFDKATKDVSHVVERVKNSVMDCNGVPPIYWNQGPLELSQKYAIASWNECELALGLGRWSTPW